jgi:hypothetical protein
MKQDCQAQLVNTFNAVNIRKKFITNNRCPCYDFFRCSWRQLVRCGFLECEVLLFPMCQVITSMQPAYITKLITYIEFNLQDGDSTFL